VVFADDLTFLSLDLRALEQVATKFKTEAREYDLELNAGKSKWMMFLPEDPENSAPPASPLSVTIDGSLIENVDTFVYLGYELDCQLDDVAHTTRVNDRLLKAARATGQIMREMKCSNLSSLRKYFLSLVASQIYGSVFFEHVGVEWAKAVGIFVRSALSLPVSFPNSICVALLGLRSHRFKFMTERMKFLIKLESRPGTPSYAALVYDRCLLMPRKIGVNAQLGSVFERHDILPTFDFVKKYSTVFSALERLDVEERTASLLDAGGRAFWTEISPDGWIPRDLALIINGLPYEQVRILCLFLADALKWSALLSYKPCPFCREIFSSAHFFCCSCSFLSGREWSTFIVLCQHGAWQDVVEVIFAILKRWVTETELFRPAFVLNVLEFVPGDDPNPFRLNIF
jgi:hypothetical protein